MNPTNPLENLSRPGGSLKPEPPDAAEIAGLQRTGRARLADAGNTTLALESRFDLAYNAAHALCLAALRAKGYRAGNRYIVFQVLPKPPFPTHLDKGCDAPAAALSAAYSP